MAYENLLSSLVTLIGSTRFDLEFINTHLNSSLIQAMVMRIYQEYICAERPRDRVSMQQFWMEFMLELRAQCLFVFCPVPRLTGWVFSWQNNKLSVEIKIDTWRTLPVVVIWQIIEL